MAIAARIAATADASGLEYAGVQDHPYNPGFVDTLTQITWLAAHTSSVHFFPNVADLPLRPPVMLAKQAATIDVLSGGRFELGLGAGAFRDAIAGMGGPRRTVAEARRALSEAIDIVRATWTGQPFRFAGEHYQIPQAQPGPRPAHEIGIWLGVAGPRAVRLAGVKADGWSVSAPYVPLEQLRSQNNILTASGEEAGRDPERIVRLYNVMGLITPDSRDMFNGPVGRWVDTLTTLYIEYQMNTFIFWPSGDRERQSPDFRRGGCAPGAPGRSPLQQPSQAAVGEVHHVRTMRLLPSAAKAAKHARRGRSGRSRPALPMQNIRPGRLSARRGRGCQRR